MIMKTETRGIVLRLLEDERAKLKGRLAELDQAIEDVGGSQPERPRRVRRARTDPAVVDDPSGVSEGDAVVETPKPSGKKRGRPPVCAAADVPVSKYKFIKWDGRRHSWEATAGELKKYFHQTEEDAAAEWIVENSDDLVTIEDILI